MSELLDDRLDPPQLPNLPQEIVPLRARQFRIPKTLNALRHRNFRLYVAGQLLSTMGTWMQIIAQGWLVYQLSQSELMLGVVGFASAIPALLITPWGGVIVDSVSKRKLMVITQSCSMVLALILAGLTFSGVVQVWHVLILAACAGIVNSFDGPARQAFVVEMVGKADMPNAIAINSMTFNTARMVGPAIAGILLVVIGPAWCFTINGISFLAVITGLLLMQLPPTIPKAVQAQAWQQLRSGLSYAVHADGVGALLLVSLTLSLFGITYSTVLPAFVDQVLHQDARAYGTINMASGIGAVLAAVLVARFGDRGFRGRWLRMVALAYPLVLLAFGVTSFYPLSIGLSVLLGMGFMNQFTLINTLLQSQIADEMRGRVMSLYTITFFGLAPFGNLAMGALSEAWGISLTISISAIIALALMGVIFYKMPRIRQLA